MNEIRYGTNYPFNGHLVISYLRLISRLAQLSGLSGFDGQPIDQQLYMWLFAIF